jgi:hypothetical protein
MVRVRVRVRVGARVVVAFSVWTQFTVSTGKRSGLPRGMTLVTRMEEFQANMRGTNGILGCKFLPERRRTVPSIFFNAFMSASLMVKIMILESSGDRTPEVNTWKLPPVCESWSKISVGCTEICRMVSEKVLQCCVTSSVWWQEFMVRTLWEILSNGLGEGPSVVCEEESENPR